MRQNLFYTVNIPHIRYNIRMDKIGSPIDNKLNLANDKKKNQLAKDGAKNIKSKKADALSKTKKSTSSSSSSAKSASSKSKSGDYSVDLSDKSKSLATELAKEAAKSTLVNAVKPGDKKPIPVDNKEKALADKDLKADEAKKLEKIKKKNKTAKKPGIFFVGGMEISGASSERYGGIRGMAEATKGSRMYGWDQQASIINEIEKRNDDQPIILVGHSFGGDSAVEIANELNTLEHGFRKVDLLVTIDSVGANNDIIPTNVKKNMNYFSEDLFLSDEPNVARNAKKTDVQNYLRNEGHTEIDDHTEVQSDILEAISNLVP